MLFKLLAYKHEVANKSLHGHGHAASVRHLTDSAAPYAFIVCATLVMLLKRT